MKKFLLIVAVSGILFSFDLPKNALKKMDKTLASLWPEQVVSKSEIVLNQTQQDKLSFNLGSNTLFKLSTKNNPVAYMYLSEAKSKISNFDYMVIFKEDLSILKVKVLVYREEYGGEIGSNRWLKQFIGKSNPEKMQFGHDIQNISGATISARNITHDVKKTTLEIIELKKKGMI